MRVRVIIPTYNRPHMLRRALRRHPVLLGTLQVTGKLVLRPPKPQTARTLADGV